MSEKKQIHISQEHRDRHLAQHRGTTKLTASIWFEKGESDPSKLETFRRNGGGEIPTTTPPKHAKAGVSSQVPGLFLMFKNIYIFTRVPYRVM